MSKRTRLFVAVVTLLVSAATQIASAQDAGKPTPPPDRPQYAYRLDFSINEISDGKKVNSRQYSMNLKAPDGAESKIGTRVPVETKQGEYNYLDVGTSLWCRLRDQADVPGLGSDVLLNVRVEVSDVVPPPPGQGERATPPLRQMRIEGSTIAVLGKPMVVGAVDDPNSKRQFQLEVTVTRLK